MRIIYRTGNRQQHYRKNCNRPDYPAEPQSQVEVPLRGCAQPRRGMMKYRSIKSIYEEQEQGAVPEEKETIMHGRAPPPVPASGACPLLEQQPNHVPVTKPLDWTKPLVVLRVYPGSLPISQETEGKKENRHWNLPRKAQPKRVKRRRTSNTSVNKTINKTMMRCKLYYKLTHLCRQIPTLTAQTVMPASNR